MKTPRFTDTHKFPVPYKPAASTDITATFRRVKAQQAKDAAEREQKVSKIRRKA